MAEEFLETEPDSMFPCSSDACVRTKCVDILNTFALIAKDGWDATVPLPCHPTDYRSCTIAEASSFEVISMGHDLSMVLPKLQRDEFGRCNAKTKNPACANCNCRMLFNQLECVKVDLETTKETLEVTVKDLHETKEELHSAKVALEECKKERNEEKRQFASAIAKMVQSEMSDVRTQLSALNLCLKDELGEKSLSKRSACEAAKAALSASKFITLRLLMF